MQRKKVFSVEDALLTKPTNLGDVELVLQKPPFRDFNWRNQSNERLPESGIANSWLALRGWVVDEYKFADSEGPEFTINYAYQVKDKTFLGLLQVGYDGMHWPMSSPDHWDWFKLNMKTSNPLTILVDPSNHANSLIFGQLEAFLEIEKNLKWIAR